MSVTANEARFSTPTTVTLSILINPLRVYLPFVAK